MAAALSLLLMTTMGCGDGTESDGDSFDLCRDSQPTCHANCEGTETLEPTCSDGQWQCPGATVDPDGPECEEEGCGDEPANLMCAPGCGGDVFIGPECTDGEWRCPENSVNVDDCPDDTCWGLPRQCRVGCVDEEFAQPSCKGGTWECEDAVEPSVCENATCESVDESTLPGVTITIELNTCTWTVYEVRDGFMVDYTIEVEEPVEVQPTEQDAGGCGSNVHPLDPFYRFGGESQGHCRCDVGRCMPDDEWITLEPGTYTATVEWAGRNWSGPSDTGNEPDEVFPPGSYVFGVTAQGKYRTAAGEERDYLVSSQLEFELVE
jgi:hypothetical protein